MDCLVVGGGIAGLWTLRTLTDMGINAALVETAALGAGQTIASQGILHAGTKYALTGAASRASKAAGEAAAIWRDCLEGTGPVDLRDAELLSRDTFMFTTPGMGSRLAGLAASKALVSGPRACPPGQRPEAFDGAPSGVSVYRLDEPVVDLPALLRALAEPVSERIFRADAVRLTWGEADNAVIAHCTCGAEETSIHPGVVVCAAGAGNESLLIGLASTLRMQRRPLHMVLARGRLPLLYAHCVGVSDKPRVTITSAIDAAGRTVWYIGGTAAEDGVERSQTEQIERVKDELGEVVPWIPLDGAEFTTFRVDRAEGFDAEGRRPDTPVVRAHGPVIAAWPTKLVLAPLAAAAVAEQLRTAHVSPRPGADCAPLPGSLLGLARPVPATPIWDRDDLDWT